MTSPESHPAPARDPRLADPRLRARLDYDDARLLAECDVHTHRTGGPGGQHRNKTATAVRLVHRPSGLVVTATERRSQPENKAKALQRLREAIAVHVRAPLPLRLAWPATVQIVDGCLRMGAKNPATHHVLALALDALLACGGRWAEAAACLGVTPSSLRRFLSEHAQAWAEASRIRHEVAQAKQERR